MENNIRIYFGKVKSVEDPEKINRIQVAIPGFTDKLEPTDLPWYYPWYGINYLPLVDDTVPVLIFDDNFVTAFYGNKVDLNQSNLDGDDYNNYLEVFKRSISDDELVAVTYTKSKGLEFLNKDGGVNIKIDKVLMFVKSTQITIDTDKISLGSDGLEKSLLGDKTVKHLHNIIKHQQDTINKMFEGFQKVIAGCTTPFTVPIAAQLATYLPQQAKLIADNKVVDSEADRLQTDLVYIGTK